MKLAASASFRAAGAGGDVDPDDERPARCGYVNHALTAHLAKKGVRLLPCDREPVDGHFHSYMSEAL